MPHAYTIVVTVAHTHNQLSVAASKTNIRSIPHMNHSIYIDAPPQTLEQRSKPIFAFPIY